MSFFDFVKQDDGERLLHDLSSEAEGVGGAVTNETVDVVDGDKFVHVETNNVVFAVEVDFGKSFGKFGFTDTGGAEEKEGADRALTISDAGTGATQGIGDTRNSFGLVDHAVVDELFEIEEFVTVFGIVSDFNFDAVRFFDGGLNRLSSDKTVIGVTCGGFE